MKNYFYLDETPTVPNKVRICVNHERFNLEYTYGSFNIICARVMGLTYANYLRLCRDRYGADLIGKHNKYPVAYFDRGAKVDELVKILNAHAKEIMKGRN